MSWNSPFSLPGSWFKGNLHTHTTQSDGLFTPEEAVAWYREHEYDFIAITDHGALTHGQSHGPGNDFITITGSELDGPGYHLLALGISALPVPKTGLSPQAAVDAVLDLGGLAFFAHPYWTGQTSADIAAVQGMAGIEVYNSVCEKMDGLGYAHVHWDDLLAQGLRLTGLAVDDVHWKHGAQGQGFVMVRARSLDEDSLLAAIRRGEFFASSGPQITDLRVVQQGNGQPALRVQCSPCESITFYAFGPRGDRCEATPGEILDSATFELKPEQVYLRVECRDGRGRIAWTNPVFVEDVLGG